MAWITIKMNTHFSTFFVLGNVNFSVSTEAVHPLELCGNEVADVPEIGRKDTIIKTLLVEASQSLNHRISLEALAVMIKTTWPFLR